METSPHYLESLNPLLEPKRGSWMLLVGPASLNAGLLQGIARFAGSGRVTVLDGGNRFNAYTVARAARGRSDVLARIHVARAFTCFQALALLEGTPADSGPFVLLDLLRTFYDESVPPAERKRLLRLCLAQLRRLEASSGGLVSVHPPARPSPAALELLHLLEAGAGAIYLQPPPVPAALPQQMRFF
ncbi:MAG TPA: hypothetical protein VMT91_13975 [Anaerolineales bacterium]|nr:hypothetical protein [Anaerolineales bacterium]